jgi:hypothetical protein
METVIIAAIIAVAAAYTARSLHRAASAGKRPCGCEDGCPISERCDPEDGRCVVTDRALDNVAGNKRREIAK